MPSIGPERPRLLLLGGTGQLGRELLRAFGDTMDVEAPTRMEVDMMRPDSVGQAIVGFQPHWIINASAYTAVDRAEVDAGVAQTVNSESVRMMAEEAAQLGAAVIHYSTDYVFDGTKSSAYDESDSAAPANAYGRSKLGGERALAHSGASHLIFRISWLYGATSTNFLRTILRLVHKAATSNVPVRIVNDQHGSPTWTRDVAEATKKIVDRISAEAQAADVTPAQAMKRYNGVYHLCGSGETTWYGFAAEALVQLYVLMPKAKWGRIVPITTAEYITPAKRPKNSRLDCSRIKRVFNVQLPPWQESLTCVLKEIVNQGEQGLS